MSANGRALLGDPPHRGRLQALVAVGVGRRSGGGAQRGLVVVAGQDVRATPASPGVGRAGVDLDHLALEEAADAADQAGALALDDRVGPELLADLGQHLLEAAPAVRHGVASSALTRHRRHAAHRRRCRAVSTRRPGGASW